MGKKKIIYTATIKLRIEGDVSDTPEEDLADCYDVDCHVRETLQRFAGTRESAEVNILESEVTFEDEL